MNDLINRQDVIDAIIKLKHKPEFNSANSIRDCYVLTEAQEAIKHLPSAEPEILACGNGELDAQTERKHGKWKICDAKPPTWWYECSVCGNAGNIEYNYCPNCGADMRNILPKP